MRERHRNGVHFERGGRGLHCLLAVSLLCCVPGPGAAESHEARHRVSFRVEAQRSVENDRVRAVLVASAEEVDPTECAQIVNQAMGWALEQARSGEGVEVSTSAYHTQPVYDEGRIRRWRARQELSLRSADTEAVVKLVTRLQSRLTLQSFTFSLSPERRERTEDALIEEALGGFQRRAELVRRSLAAQGWRIDEIDIDANRQPIPVRHGEARAMLASKAPVAVEAGTSQVSIHVRATIVLE